MNILVFSWRDPKHPLAGGAEQVMHEHAKGWVERGHKVIFFSSAFSGGEKEDNLDGVLIKRQGVQLLGVHFLAFIWYVFKTEVRFDLVVDQFHGIPFFTPLYVRVPKLAIVQEVAREVWFMNHLPRPLNWLAGWVGYLTEPLVFLLYKKVHFMTGSKSAKKDVILMGIAADNVSVVPHGVIIEPPKENYSKENIKTIMFLGALTKDKGVEDTIKTFSILDKKDRFKFWIVGKGSPEYLRYLQNLTKAEDMNAIKFWGFVPQEKKFELLTRAHILVNPSAREGWGLVNVEANTMGTPVVAYNSPGLVDSVKNRESGLICRENTPQDMADIVYNVLRDRTLYLKLCKGARKWASNFSWDESKKQSLRLIESVAQR